MSLDEMMVLLRVDILQRYACLKNQQSGSINFVAGQKVQGIFMILKWWVLEILKAPLLPWIYRVDSSKNLVMVSWYDNRGDLTISNFIRKEPVEECKRYEKKQKETVYLPRPASVGLYNRFMEGVDKAYMLLALHKTKCKISKWYRITFHLFSLAVVNAWVVYREIGGSGALLPFL